VYYGRAAEAAAAVAELAQDSTPVEIPANNA